MRHSASSVPYDEEIGSKTVVLVNPPTELMAGYISQIRAAHGESVSAAIRALASGSLPIRVSRISERVLEIESLQGLLHNLPGYMFRGRSHPMRAGERIELSGMTIDVLALADDWQPSRVRFTFAVPLEDSSFHWLQWDRDRFVAYAPPAVGWSETLPADANGPQMLFSKLYEVCRKSF